MHLSLTRALVATAIVATLGIPGPVAAQDGPVILTVTGAVENPNRDPIDPDMDVLFAFNEVSFDRAMEFDLDTLRALPQVTVEADFPMGGAVQEFTGPRLADVLAAAGAGGETVTMQALDGYAVQAPYTELAEKGAVLALERNGTPLAIGGYGPAQIVFPRAEREELAQMNDDWWIWQVFHVSVE